MAKTTKVYKVVLMVVDHDGIGIEDVEAVLEDTHYPNHCIYPTVMEVETEEVDWADDHPLNARSTQSYEFHRLFGFPMRRA